MTKFERRTFFEKLCQLREAYRATDHVATQMTVDAAIAFGNAALTDDVVIDLEFEAPATADRRAA